MTTNSVLSAEPDGMGCWYGRAPGDPRLINVWMASEASSLTSSLKCPPRHHGWVASVGSETVDINGVRLWPSKGAAEMAAIEWIKLNPMEGGDGA